MSEGTLSIIAFFLGVIIGVIFCIPVVSDNWKKEAVTHGHAEFYIDSTTFQKKWRWKE